MLLDVSNVHGEHSSLDDIHELQEVLSQSVNKRYDYLCVQHNSLSTLGISSSLAITLQHITSLTASHNRISTLQGVDAFPCVEVLDLSHNALRVLDAHSTSLLRRLRRLRRCDFSHNEIRLIDLDAPSRSGSVWNDTHAGENNTGTVLVWEELVEINFSHNQLIEVPDLRCMPLLEMVNLEHNRIEYINDMDSRLPLLALHSLFMAYNFLSSLQHLVSLTVFAETLKTLTLKGNPCVSDTSTTTTTSNANSTNTNTNNSTTSPVVVAANANPIKSSVRSWLLWLLPHLETIDNIAITTEERYTTVHLFRHQGELSYDAMEVMNGHHGNQLEVYLQKFTTPPQYIHASSDSLLGVKREAPTNNNHNNNNTTATPTSTTVTINTPVNNTNISTPPPPPSLGGMTARLPSSASVSASLTSNPNRPISMDFVLQMMQKKLKQLSDVMEVLWKESMTRRVFATIVLQKYVRGFLTRLHLPQEIERVCGKIREKMYRNRRRNVLLQYQLSSLSSHQQIYQQQLQQQQQQNVNNSNSNNNNNNNAEMMRQFRNFDSQLRHMWSEMNEFQRLINHRKNTAAITIQKYYRGYVDRKQWRNLKESYDGFVASLRPDVVVLQQVCRGYLVRRKLRRRYMQTNELRLLRTEVAELRQTVHDMKILMEQNMRRQRLDRYTDPEKAMEEIIARHTAPRTDRLTETVAVVREEIETVRSASVSSVLEDL